MFNEFSMDQFFSRGDIIVDVGSWDNIEPSLTLASIGCSVFPIDKYQRMEEFKEKLLKSLERGEIEHDKAGKIHPMKADINELPFINESVDGVLFYYSTSWLQQFGADLLVVYKEVNRVLKEYGIVMLFEQTVMRAKEQESFLKTQLKTNRIGTIVLGTKIKSEKLPFNLKSDDLKLKNRTKDK